MRLQTSHGTGAAPSTRLGRCSAAPSLRGGGGPRGSFSRGVQLARRRARGSLRATPSEDAVCALGPVPDASSREGWEAAVLDMLERFAAHEKAMSRPVPKTAPDQGGVQLPPPCRVFTISDIHTDSEENRGWVEALSDTEYQHDTIIVAGDVSHHIGIVRRTLETFAAKFRHVFFVPGNHDLWCTGDGDTAENSVQKLDQILELCAEVGVHTQPTCVGVGEESVWIVPMLSWYHPCFDTEPSIPDLKVPPITRVMTDFRACKWPEGMDPLSEDVALYMDKLNERVTSTSTGVDTVHPEAVGLSGNGLWEHIEASNLPVISFSHFLPRLELCPEKRFLMYSELPKAIGSRSLGHRVDALKPDLHIFGHTHFGWDQEIDGVRYIQAALAYPYERSGRMRSLSVGTNPNSLLKVFDSSEKCSFPDEMSAAWSDYYKCFPRDPTNPNVAWWVKKKFRRRAVASTSTSAKDAPKEASTKAALFRSPWNVSNDSKV